MIEQSFECAQTNGLLYVLNHYGDLVRVYIQSKNKLKSFLLQKRFVRAGLFGDGVGGSKLEG